MSRKTEIVTAVATVSCAIGIGFVMQSGEVAELRYGTTPLQTASALPVVGEPVASASTPENALTSSSAPLSVDGITLTSAQMSSALAGFDAELLLRASLDDTVFDLPGAAGQPHTAQEARTPKCEIEASALPQAAAMIAFSLSAPCSGGAHVTVSHQELVFSAQLDEAGNLQQEVPALAADAKIDVHFATGETVQARAEIKTLPLYDRVVVQWQGPAGIQIHAREFGAGYGDDGHVWSGAGRDLTALENGRGGYLTKLGAAALDNAQMAEVYTYPSTITTVSGAIELTVEAEVTAQNCNNVVMAHAHRYSAGRQITSQDVTISMPECDAVGSFLVLNNLLEDLTVARK